MATPAWANTRYEDVYAYIQRGIASGVFSPGSRLAGERKIAEQLDVSRETVRLGLKLAEEAGLVVRLPTRGTFVATPRVNQDLGEMHTFQSTVRDLRLDPTYRLLSNLRGEADRQESERLQVGEGSKVLKLEVLGMASGLPMALYQSTLPGWVLDLLPLECEWGASASYAIVARVLGARKLRVVQEFEAISIPRVMTQALQVKTGSPGFQCTSVFFVSESDKPIELRTAWYPGSRYHFTISRPVKLED